MSLHLPFLWKFRLLRAIHARGTSENRKLLDRWQRAEGGTARFNPLNSTQPWPGATEYNSAGVKDYPTGAAGIAATAHTLVLPYYAGIVKDLRSGKCSAREMVERNAHEFDTWGTGSEHVLRML